MKRAVLVLTVALAASLAPSAWAWRAPTTSERQGILSALPPLYHQACVRPTVRISSVENRFAGVFFRFVVPPAGQAQGCLRFANQVLLKRVTPAHWQRIAADDVWPCHITGVGPHAHRVIKDLFGRCVQ